MADEKQAEGLAGRWGIDDLRLLRAWRQKRVRCRLQDGTEVVGGLAGYGPYWIVLLTAEPEELIAVSKGAITWMKAEG